MTGSGESARRLKESSQEIDQGTMRVVVLWAGLAGQGGQSIGHLLEVLGGVPVAAECCG